MLAYTLKNYIYNLSKYAGSNAYEFKFDGYITHNKYTILIKDGITLTVETPNGLAVRTAVTDVYKLKFYDKLLIPKSLEEISFRPDGMEFEKNFANIYYEAQLYVKLFRLMKERVNFTFICDNKYYDCYYLDGKVFYIEETATDYRVRGTTLFKLGNTFPNYRICYVSQSLKRLQYGDYMDEQHEIANRKGKRFDKFKFDVRIPKTLVNGESHDRIYKDNRSRCR